MVKAAEKSNFQVSGNRHSRFAAIVWK